MSAPARLDTGAIYALADRNDADHAAVRAIYLDASRRFVTHDLVLVEAFSLLTKRLHKPAALQTIGALRRSAKVEIVPLTAHLLDAAWARCERYADKEWDWIDCTSFELMEPRSPLCAGGICPAIASSRVFVATKIGRIGMSGRDTRIAV